MYRKVMAAALMVALATGAGACGPAKAPAAKPKTTASAVSPLDWVRASLQKSTKANTCKLGLDMTVTANGQTVELKGNGSMQFQPAAIDVAMTGSAKVSGQTVPVKMHMIAIGSDTYQQLNGQPWKKQEGTGGLGGGGSQTDALAGLSSVGKVTSTGKTTLNGQSVTAYDAEIDLDKAIAAATSPAQKKQFQDMKTGLGKSTLPVWIDDAGRLVQYKFSTAVVAQGQTVNIAMTMTMTDYGTPVKIVAPQTGGKKN